jgi:hypothetical protein
MSLHARVSAFLTPLALASACGPAPQSAFDPVTADLAATDTVGPPTLISFQLDVSGSSIHGVAYLAQGVAPHPTLLLLPGYPGYERHLDVAHAVRRAGVNVISISYRGTWGSGGLMSPMNAVQDVAAAVAHLREPDGARRYRTDSTRIALLGHSLGSWVALNAAAADPRIDCVGGLATTNLGLLVRMAMDDERFRGALTQSIRAAAGPDGPVRLLANDPVAELVSDPDVYDLLPRAPALAPKAVLLAGARQDREAVLDQHHIPFAAALRDAGARRLTEVVLDTDHNFSATRIALARAVVGWLRNACGY